MIAEFKHTLRRLRGQAISWSIGLALLGLLVGAMYSSVSEMEGISELLESYPQEIIAFFGDMAEMTTPWGYLDVEYFTFTSMIIGIFTIGTCVKLFAGDEEKGLLDLALAHPVSRSSFFWGRLLAFLLVSAAVLAAAWLALAVPSDAFGFDLTPAELARPFVSLFAILMFFSTLGLLASLILPSSRSAGMLAGALLVGNFLLIGLSNLNEDLQSFVKSTPMYYYQSGDAIRSLDWGWAMSLLSVALLFTLLAWFAFIRRDIRVSGEHNWPLSIPLLVRTTRDKVSLAINITSKTRLEEGGPPASQQVRAKQRRKLLLITLAAIWLVIILCAAAILLIDVSDLWCEFFAGVFNGMRAGTCP